MNKMTSFAMARLAKYPVRRIEMSEEFDPVVEIDERDCIGTAEEEVYELKLKLGRSMEREKENFLDLQQRTVELTAAKLMVQAKDDELEEVKEELEQAKEQIKKCHARLARWGEILGVIKFSMRDVDKA
jgi:uncharacterized protein (DUF342 family)